MKEEEKGEKWVRESQIQAIIFTVDKKVKRRRRRSERGQKR
jgi:hypothetical protein